MTMSTSKNNTVANKKAGWKGITLKQKPRTTSSRPESVASAQSVEASSQQSIKNEPVTKVQAEPVAVAKTTAEPSDSVPVDDSETPTPRAPSRASSIAGLDSASEVFEDAYDDDAAEDELGKENHVDLAFQNAGLLDDTKAEDNSSNSSSVSKVVEALRVHDVVAEKTSSEEPREESMQQHSEQKEDGDEVFTAEKTASKSPVPDEAAATTSPAIDEENLPQSSVVDEKAASQSPVPDERAAADSPAIDEENVPESSMVDEKAASESMIPSADANDEKDVKDKVASEEIVDEQTNQHEAVVDVLADLERTEQVSPATSANYENDNGHADSGDPEPRSEESTSSQGSNSTRSSSVDNDQSKTSTSDVSDRDCLGAIMPAMEEAVRETIALSDPKPSTDASITSEDRSRADRSREFEHSIEDPIDLDMFRDNAINIQLIDTRNIPINDLSPREQEEADEPVREGMAYLFDNKFMKAKAIFQTKANIDPLYALGLGAMAFIKAMMTYHEKDVNIAMNALATAYNTAKSQIENASFKRSIKESVSQYFSTLLNRNKSGLPASPPPASRRDSHGFPKGEPNFIPNGVLRAHVIKAECCLLMAVLQMTQESVLGYLRCGLNLRRAYSSYSIVWQEYKRMGQQYTKYMDRDTVSAIQFGIGAVHLLLSSMPAKILKIFSTLGWTSDKELGFALLKLCLEGRGIRAPLASLTLLSYYSVLTSFAPQIYAKSLMSPAIECLLDAQKHHPNSCFFLFFAARIARVARNIPLSTQSFTFASESSRGEWAEVAMRQMADYEIGFNLALQLDWEGAAAYFEQLSREKYYWSPAFCRYFAGACREMLGQRTESILAFAEVIPELASIKGRKTKTYIDAYVQRKVEFFQRSGYQDMDFSLPGLEILLVWNAFEQMEPEALEKCLETVQRTLELIYEREKMEYNIRLRELVPTTTPPDYYDQRAVLLLIKAAVLNALGRYRESIAHLNWIMDHKDCIKHDTWVVPFAYWEAGVTSWGLGNIKKSRKLWQLALACSKYDFEYRMAVRLSLALSKCDELGVTHIEEKETKGLTTNGRKRMPILGS